MEMNVKQYANQHIVILKVGIYAIEHWSTSTLKQALIEAYAKLLNKMASKKTPYAQAT